MYRINQRCGTISTCEFCHSQVPIKSTDLRFVIFSLYIDSINSTF
jgi:hypothetical protein